MNNLYKIRLGLLLAKIRLGGIYTRDTFREEDHPRDEAGKFAKGGSTTAGSRAKINVSPTGANKFVKRGFASKQKLMNHWKNGRTHADEFPEIKTAQEYERRALELIEKPVGGSILGQCDDAIQEDSPDYAGGANIMSLNEARKAYREGRQVR